jgi:type II secretory pathway pseudopilin PulG
MRHQSNKIGGLCCDAQLAVLPGIRDNGRTMSSGRLRNSQGVTLVELMIAIGLTGISTLAVMTLMANYSEQVARQQNEANLSEQLAGFADILEAYVGNATLIQSCGCANGCIYTEDAAVTDCTFNTGCTINNILQFEYEDSVDPGVPAAGTCEFAAGFDAGAAPDRLIPRGCKRRARLVYSRPVLGSNTPGTLSVFAENPATGNPVGEPMLTLQGVTQFRCGHPRNSQTGLADPNSFRISIAAKSRATNLPPGDPLFDGWHPNDNGFTRGTHRTFSTDIPFRNLTTAGIQFSKSYTEKNCTIDGQVDPEANCCSGYWDPSNQTCRKMTTDANGPGCLVRGAATSSVTMCCSRMMLTAAGTCL